MTDRSLACCNPWPRAVEEILIFPPGRAAPQQRFVFRFFLHNCFAFANYYKKESRTSDPLPGRL